MTENVGEYVDEQEMQILSRPEMYKQENSILEQLNLDPLLNELYLAFLGKKFNPKTKELENEGKPIMSEVGFQRFKAMFKTTLQRNTLLSNLSMNDINAMCIEFVDNTVWLIAEKRKEYEIEQADRDIIVDVLDRIFYMTLKRAESGLERKSAREHMSVNEIRRNDIVQDKKRRLSLGPI